MKAVEKVSSRPSAFQVNAYSVRRVQVLGDLAQNCARELSASDPGTHCESSRWLQYTLVVQTCGATFERD